MEKSIQVMSNHRPNVPPRGNTQNSYGYGSLNTQGLDQATLNRLQNLEIDHVTKTSKLEQEINQWKKQCEDLQMICVTKDSLLTALEKKKNDLSRLLEKEQSDRIRERKQLMTATNNNDTIIRDLQAQLQEERFANQQMDAYLQELTAQTQLLTSNQQEIDRLNAILEQERYANRLLDEKAMSLQKQLNARPLPSVPTIDPQLQKKLEAEIEQLHNKVQSLEDELDIHKNDNSLNLLQEKYQKDVGKLKAENSNLQDQLSVLQSDNSTVFLQEKYEKEISRLKNELQNATMRQRTNSSAPTSTNANIPVVYTKNTGGNGVKLHQPQGFDQNLWPIYLASDKLGTYRLDAGELCEALAKGQWPPLSIKTCIMLIRNYDGNGDYIPADAFTNMWHFVEQCKKVFEKYDVKRISPTIWGYSTPDSLPQSLFDLGIKLPKKANALLVKYKTTPDMKYTWDEFVLLHANVRIWMMEFDRVDLDGDRAITILYEQFMNMVAKCI
ncbi:peflin or Penta-EF hand domain-containing protein 1 [Boothiomyces sp. JEL0866]|nr:peflin or Penta-EF hand domain-containing protein 1 [Boothiomyces sp. JEL0866]